MDAMTGLLRRTLGWRIALRQRIIGIYAVLTLANLAAWVWAVSVFRDRPVLLGTALLAYGFGLRHAVDADHIAAIDNVTRKLMQMGKRPVGVGLFFALGHSSVVILAAACVAGTATALSGSLDRFKAVGGVLGTGVSALFLFAIAAVNLIILRDVWRTFRHVHHGGRYAAAEFDQLLEQRGLYARLFRPLFLLIGESWHMYPLGFMFGLGFDTATEIALLAVAASAAAKGVSISAIMVFPALFAAGMSLVDTSDGILMLVVAVLIGGIETLGLLGDRFALRGAFWNGVGALHDNFTALGVAVIGLLLAGWGGSAIVYHCKGLDEIPVSSAER
jgi:high-affinity nickel-transport protein